MTGLLVTVYAGFAHAFETDHLLAVSSIVTGRDRLRLAAKDGIYWGLGHTSTILLIGLLMLALKMNIAEQVFAYFEAVVGAMLVLLALYRLYKWHGNKQPQHRHTGDGRGHRLAYGVGMVHGLAGSGALVVLVMAQIQSITQGLLYLFIFGLGSVLGMLLAAALVHVPFSKKVLRSGAMQTGLVWLSCLLCIAYGGKVLYQNL